MEINPLARAIAPEELPLDRLANNSQLTEEEKINGVSRHFEAILLRQFLTEAQKPIWNQKGSMSGAMRDIYQDMITTNLADEISKTGLFGLAKAFQTQMKPPPQANGGKGERDAPTQ